MPGSGTIGGGKSCLLDIDIKNQQGGNKPKWYQEDTDVQYPFTITFTFSDGTSKAVVISSKQDKVKIKWDWKWADPRS